MKEINDFIEISKYAGERFDLVQAGGGNCSVKLDTGEMIIKASGFLLSEMTRDTGYSIVETNKIAEIVNLKELFNFDDKRKREKIIEEFIKKYTISKRNRPSLETLLHSLLLKYTLHTHPFVVNIVVTRYYFKDLLNAIFRDDNIAIVDYKTPGFDLAHSLNKELKKFDRFPNIIFLQNHGLIITSNQKSEIKKLNEYVLEKIEKFLNLDISKFKLTNRISHLFNTLQESEDITYLTQDEYLNNIILTKKNLLNIMPFCPDVIVYCGMNCCKIRSISDIESIKAYKEKYHDMPKVVLYDDNLFFRAVNTKKARDIEEVFKFNVMVLEQNQQSDVNLLGFEEIAFLNNWEAEKYRRDL